MQYSSNYELNRRVGQATDGGIKVLFKWRGWESESKHLAEFLVEAHSITGKWLPWDGGIHHIK